MLSRRLIGAVAALVVVSAAAVWLWTDRLTADEVRFVGMWRLGPPVNGLVVTLKLDRRHRCTHEFMHTESGRWWVRDGRIFMDFEPSPVRRSLRPLFERVGIAVRPVGSLSVADFDFGEDATDRAAVTSASLRSKRRPETLEW